MKESLIKLIQKFLNTPFKYPAFAAFIDKQKDFLLQPNILNNTDQHEYNAIWDTINDIELKLKYAKETDFTIGAQFSVLKMYEFNLNSRRNGQG